MYLIMVYRIRFGIGPRIALSVDNDGDPLEKVNVLSSTLVRLYIAGPPCSVIFCDKIIAGFV